MQDGEACSISVCLCGCSLSLCYVISTGGNNGLPLAAACLRPSPLLHTITSFPAIMGSKQALIFLGQGAVFPCRVTLHMPSFLIPEGQEHSEETTSCHLLQRCNFNHKTVVKWISLRTKWNLHCKNWNKPWGWVRVDYISQNARYKNKQMNHVHVERITCCTNYSNLKWNTF